jgi:AcrR family transcriptional regulator
LARAIELASTDGLESLTLGRLAAEAGVGKSNLTVLFGDRQSLQLATLEAAIATIVDEVVNPALERKDPAARLRAINDRWFEYTRRQTFPGGCFMYATAHEYRARPGPIRDRIARELDAWKKLLGSTIKAGVASGAFRTDFNVRDAVATLYAYQDSAHLALLLDDKAAFENAARLARTYIASLANK